MLQHLSVKNYALIDKLNLDLSSGFSVITGETGAGKSIILGALNLVLGKRADLKVLRNPETKCVVEATFLLDRNMFLPFFSKNELDFDEETIIRREITPAGKSRAFINDTPVNLNILNELSARLIDVHSQHQNLLLSNSYFQLNLLDSYGGNQDLISAYVEKHLAYKQLNSEFVKVTESSDRQSIDVDYVNFLLNELKEAQLEEGEQAAIEEELNSLEHAEEIQDKLNTVVKLIEGDTQDGVATNLTTISQAFRQLQSFQSGYRDLAERVNALQIELEDIRQEAEQKANDTEYDPERLTKLDDRLSQLIHLQRKHAVNSVEELIAKREELDSKLDSVLNASERISELKQKMEKAGEERAAAATKLHKARVKVAPEIEKSIKSILADLNMKDASINIQVSASDNYTRLGNDSVEFRFSANKGMAPQSLSKIASGGEMSRVMLALKSVMANNSKLASIIFDEIDTGVSGETAGKIGGILQKMGDSMQVIAITHLPQIAALGKNHFKVQKKSNANSTLTDIIKLDDKNKLEEVARLLSGEHITDAALANARHLIESNKVSA